MRILEVKAIADGPRFTPLTRIGWHEGASWLDMCDDAWRAVEITGSGWEVVNKPPVKFVRSEVMAALPDPEGGHMIEELRGFVNAEDDDFKLIIGWLIASLWGKSTVFPVLALGGEQGSGKSTMARLLRTLVGPFTNSLVVTLSASFISLILGTLAAYGLSRFTYKAGPVGNADLTFFFISQRIMPPVVLAIPFFLMLGFLGLLDTILGLVIVYIALLMPIVVWVMVDFFNQIPRELDETAMIDGCNPVEAFWRVILPNSRPGLVVAGIFAVVFGWNDFFFAFTLTFTKTQLLPVAIVSLNSSVTPWWSLSAAALISLAPLILVALLVERYLDKGNIAGAGKQEHDE